MHVTIKLEPMAAIKPQIALNEAADVARRIGCTVEVAVNGIPVRILQELSLRGMGQGGRGRSGAAERQRGRDLSAGPYVRLACITFAAASRRGRAGEAPSRVWVAVKLEFSADRGRRRRTDPGGGQRSDPAHQPASAGRSWSCQSSSGGSRSRRRRRHERPHGAAD